MHGNLRDRSCSTRIHVRLRHRACDRAARDLYRRLGCSGAASSVRHDNAGSVLLQVGELTTPRNSAPEKIRKTFTNRMCSRVRSSIPAANAQTRWWYQPRPRLFQQVGQSRLKMAHVRRSLTIFLTSTWVVIVRSVNAKVANGWQVQPIGKLRNIRPDWRSSESMASDLSNVKEGSSHTNHQHAATPRFLLNGSVVSSQTACLF